LLQVFRRISPGCCFALAVAVAAVVDLVAAAGCLAGGLEENVRKIRANSRHDVEQENPHLAALAKPGFAKNDCAIVTGLPAIQPGAPR
jgi:hypothetical protein